jgi:outer membrane beta-barrel protein
MRARPSILLLLTLAGGAASADCVDEAEKARLLEAKRGRLSSVDRDVPKAGRHELSLWAGYYVSDLLDGTFVVTGAYTYHLTEDWGIEASFGWSKLRSSVASRLEADRGVSVLPPDDRVLLLFTDLVWAPLHGKAQLFTASIVHFDFYLVAGAGVIDNSTSLGAAGQFGVGMKMFLHPAVAVRVDVRDHLYQQQVLATHQYVNDFAVTLGLSLLLPVSP